MRYTDVRAEVFSPSEFLQEELAARNWTVDDLAARCGRPYAWTYALVMGQLGITPTTARILEAALGVSASFWLNLAEAYRRG